MTGVKTTLRQLSRWGLARRTTRHHSHGGEAWRIVPWSGQRGESG